MTDNEIVKALNRADVFLRVFLRNRANAKLAPLNEYDNEVLLDIAKVCNEAASLINSQKAKIEAQQMDNRQLESDIINANQNNDHIKELWEYEKEKVTKAKQKLINVCKKLQTAKIEIELLKKQNDEMWGSCQIVMKAHEERSERLYQEAKATIRPKAIKEFAERLKSQYPNKYLVWGGGKCSIKFVDFVDNLVAELVGENDDG